MVTSLSSHAGPTVRRHRVSRPRPGAGAWTLGVQGGVAAEREGAYAVGPQARPDEGPGDGAREGGGPPFGLSVLDDLPQLATVLEQLATADRTQLHAVAGLADLLADDEVERTTGVGVEHWLAVVACQTQMDRRLLMRTCRLLHRLPTLDDAVRRARVSFPQLRGLSLALRGVATELDAQVDQMLAAVLDGLEEVERPDPDVVVRQVLAALDELDHDDLAARERDARAGRYLHLQPRLDGTGGRFVGELDAPGLALLDAATTPPAALRDLVASSGAARADTLLARLAGGLASDATDGPGDARVGADGGLGADGDPVGELSTGAEREPAEGWWDDLPSPTLLLRLPFETLLDDRMPADLLTSLTGGRLRMTAAAARRLVDTAGARLRTIVVDGEGAVLGVGRSTRRPPGWLTDAIAAIHDTCTAPGCDRSALTTQNDHATPWWPARPDQAPGRTDLDELGPLCATTNRAKESSGWQVVQTANGTRTWRHDRSGLVTTTVPATWRPPDDPRRRPPPRPAPPGPLDGSGPAPPATVSDHEPGPLDPDQAGGFAAGDEGVDPMPF